MDLRVTSQTVLNNALAALGSQTTLLGKLAGRGWDRRFSSSLAAMTLGHLLILACGVTWLAATLGLERAWAVAYDQESAQCGGAAGGYEAEVDRAAAGFIQGRGASDWAGFGNAGGDY